MFNIKKLLCCLLVSVLVLSGTAFATTPYASIVVYNEMAPGLWGNGGKNNPEVSTLGVLDIINMTPWNISIGPGPQGTPMFCGMTTNQPYNNMTSLWLAGIYGANFPNTKTANNATNFGGSFAFHSIQVPLANLNNVWQLQNTSNNTSQNSAYNKITGVYSQPIYTCTEPIAFNSNSFATNGISLNLTATSTEGFDVPYASSTENYPATALSFGDGTNNYGWESNDTMIYYSSWKNTTHFMTIQAPANSINSAWKPITAKLAKASTQNGVVCPMFLNLSGLVYPNFPGGTGDGLASNLNMDLVVILQAGGYADVALIFLAVPSENDAFLAGSTSSHK